MVPVQKALVPLRTSRGEHKSWITHGLNKMKSCDDDKSLTPSVFACLESLISAPIDQVKYRQEEILQVLEAHSFGVSDATRVTDQTETVEFIFSTLTELAKYEDKVKASGGKAPAPVAADSIIDLVAALQQLKGAAAQRPRSNCSLLPLTIVKKTISFVNFLKQFITVFDSVTNSVNCIKYFCWFELY